MIIVKFIYNLIVRIALIAFVLLAFLLVGLRFTGLDPHIVLSGSMEPEIMTGSLVFVQKVSAEEAQNLKAGETVTYVADSSGTKVTHKIYEVVGPLYVKNQYGEYVLDENGEKIVAKDDLGNPIIMYTTYGINNKNEDAESGYTLDGTLGVGNLGSPNVFGKPVFSIPYLGYVSYYIQTPTGRIVSIGICVILAISTLFGNSEPKKKKENSRS